MKKSYTIDAFFKRKNAENLKSSEESHSSIDPDPLNSESRPTKSARVEIKIGFDINLLERDPGLRLQIWEYPINSHDEVRKAYIKAGPYQCIQSKYPKSGEKHPRSFQASWFKLFPSWLEYSPSKDAAFCLPCYLFNKKDGPSGSDAFTVKGFSNWKKVNNGANCTFLAHMGKRSEFFS